MTVTTSAELVTVAETGISTASGAVIAVAVVALTILISMLIVRKIRRSMMVGPTGGARLAAHRAGLYSPSHRRFR